MRKYSVSISSTKKKNRNDDVISVEKLTVAAGDFPYFIECGFNEEKGIVNVKTNFGNEGEDLNKKEIKEGFVVSYGKKTGRIYSAELSPELAMKDGTIGRVNLKNHFKLPKGSKRFDNNISFGSKLLKEIFSRVDKCGPQDWATNG